MYSCSRDVKEAAYKTMVRPILEYGSSVWDPYTQGLQDELERVQNRAARFVTRNYTLEEGSMSGILEQLKWESLKKRRKDNTIRYDMTFLLKSHFCTYMTYTDIQC